MTELRDIIASLENLTGPSREMDLEIFRLITPDPFIDRLYGEIGEGDERTFSAAEKRWAVSIQWERGGGMSGGHPMFTASLDAIVALIEQKLPVGKYSVSVWLHFADEPAKPSGRIWNDDEDYRARGATPAIALCIALLKALESGQ